jgi:hypothetical protein
MNMMMMMMILNAVYAVSPAATTHVQFAPAAQCSALAGAQ